MSTGVTSTGFISGAGAVMVNSALLFPFTPSGPSCWLSFACTVIELVPGHRCRPGKLILGLPVGVRCIVDQEPVRYRIGFRITGLCRPVDCGSQDLRALFVCVKAGYAWRFIELDRRDNNGHNLSHQQAATTGCGSIYGELGALVSVRTLRPIMLVVFSLHRDLDWCRVTVAVQAN